MFNIGDFENKKKFDLNVLTRHAVVLGATGSGKTVLCKSIVEEAVMNHIPIIAIDPKGDISSLGINSAKFEFRPYSDIEAKSNSATPEEYQSILKERYEKNLEESNVKKSDIAKYVNSIELNIFTPKSNSGMTLSVAPNLNSPKDFKELHEKDQTISSKLIEPIAESLLLLIDYPQDSKKEIALITRIIEESWLNSRSISVTELIDEVSNPKFEKIGAMTVDSFITKKQRGKLASKLNLLISTPSLKYWFSGEDIDFGKMLSSKDKTHVNVIDLRFISDDKEKEFFIGRILGELYNWLIKQQGTQNLRYLLYIDEIKSFIPPYPNNPPSKKILDLLVRQGRAFGLGCLFATQNPGDIDYKMLGNMNTRFIGKLRTERDIEKIASGIDVPAREITKQINQLNEREFLYNKQDSNEFIRLKPRWLISYHRGPLSEEEIRHLTQSMIAGKNTTGARIDKDGLRVHDEIKENKDDNSIESDKGTFSIPLKNSTTQILSSIRRAKDTRLSIEKSRTKYTPILHCNISINDEKNKIDTRIYLDCDLSKNILAPTQMNIDEDSLNHAKISKSEKKKIFLDRDLAENQIFSRLKKNIKTKFFVSKEISFYSNDKREVIERNKKFLETGFYDTIRSIENKHNPEITKKQEKSRELARKITNGEFEIEMKKSKKERISEKEISNVKELKIESEKIRKEINNLTRIKEEAIQKEKKLFRKKTENFIEIDFGPESPEFRMESKIIWIPEQEITVKVKTKTSVSRMEIRQNHEKVLTYGTCEICKKNISDTNDLELCSHCAKTFCKRHVKIDRFSEKRYCEKHLVRCPICFRKSGMDSLKECSSCKKLVCHEDIMQCPKCGKVVCRRCMKFKGFFNRIPVACKMCKEIGKRQ